jgi:hypothetical protein
VQYQTFDNQIAKLHDWKSELNQEVARVSQWLDTNQLLNPEYQKRLKYLQSILQTDHSTLAFVGEFSRGKTELINAIFFGEHGKRILPSQAGRTTMCPTELFYDTEENRPYIRLLPIETRLQGMSLNDYRNTPGNWVDLELPINSPEGLAKAMRSVTQTKKVSLADAVAMGFPRQSLRKEMDSEGMVLIPAWRHAIVSYPHPLLEQGLRIIDTPGLNALGSEPDLTLSLLPQAQAIIFVLAADAGVTASDMDIWDNHIKQLKDLPNVGIYAVLNKIDFMWDDIEKAANASEEIQRIRDITARQLDLDVENVLSISAQKGFMAKAQQDKIMLEASKLDEVETVLSNTVVQRKQSELHQAISAEMASILGDGISIVRHKLDKIRQQRESLAEVQSKGESSVGHLIQKSEEERELYFKKVLQLKPSQRLLQKQTRILISSVSAEELSKLYTSTRHQLINSWTTVGLNKSMREFFTSLELVFKNLERQMELSNNMVHSVYERFRDTFETTVIEPRRLEIRPYMASLNRVRRNTDLYNDNVKLTMTEHSYVIKRFFSSTISKVNELAERMRRELTDWSNDAILPLIQHVESHKETLNQHIEQLNHVRHKGETIAGQLKALQNIYNEINEIVREGEKQMSRLNTPVVQSSTAKIVEMTAARR